MSSPSPLDHEEIRNTISRYCIALDTKDFNLLRQVFTEDVDTVYPFRGGIKGVQNVADAIQKRLTPITSQHALTTQQITVTGTSAQAVTYFTGIHFGKGKWEGKDVTAWGKYCDELVFLPAEKGAGNGKWLICKRTVEFMGRRGEEGVMEAE